MRNVHAMKLYFKNFEIVRECEVKRHLNKCAISSFLISILLFVSYFLISFNFYLFYFPGAAAEPLRSARGTLRAPRSTGWEPLASGVKGSGTRRAVGSLPLETRTFLTLFLFRPSRLCRGLEVTCPPVQGDYRS